MPAKLLIVEDYAEVANLMKDALEKRGYEVLLADSAPQAQRIFEQQRCDLAILDINLKEGTGYDVCRHIRSHPSRSATPVIMLTAKNSMEDKAQGFALGADNYLTKPLDMAELLLWLEALLRRVSGNWSELSVIRSGALDINAETRTVTHSGQVVRGLTAKEFDLLCELARAKPKTLSKEELHARVWHGAAATNTLEVHVKTLRRKLGPQAAAHVVTMRGVGYRFE